MSFLRPVLVGDAVGCYGEVVGLGRTSLRAHVEVRVPPRGVRPRRAGARSDAGGWRRVRSRRA
ncbi:MAG: hotdog domain-containing protein [Pseudomonadota bacterium]